MFKNESHSVRSFWDDSGNGKALPDDLKSTSGSVLEVVNQQLGQKSFVAHLITNNSKKSSLVDVLASPILSCGGSLRPIADKWQLAVDNGVKYLIVNGTEGEPFTFKDYQIMASYPQLVVESIATVATVLGVKEVRFAINKAYVGVYAVIQKAWDELQQANLTLDITLIMRLTPELYIIGEETSLIQYFEGKRGEPRLKDRLPMEVGLFKEPTIVSNIETLCWVLVYLLDQSLFETGIKKLSTIVTDENVGVYELTIGEPILEIASKFATENSKYVEIGGVSGSVFALSQLQNIKWSNESLSVLGASVGSGSLRFFSSEDDVKKAVQMSMRFFEENSCGQCAPCRVGTQRLVRAIGDNHLDVSLAIKTSKTMKMTAMCGLGKSAGNPVCSYINNIYEGASK